MPQCPNMPQRPNAQDAPDCPAGSNDIVVNVQGAGFAQPLQWISTLEVTAVAPAGGAAASAAMLLTIAGGANVTVTGKGFGSDAAQMVAKLTTPSGGSVPCVVTSTSYASLTCTTGAALAADAGLQPTLVVEVHDTLARCTTPACETLTTLRATATTEGFFEYRSLAASPLVTELRPSSLTLTLTLTLTLP